MQKTTVTYMTQVIIIGVMGFVIFLFGCAASNRQLPMPDQLSEKGVIPGNSDPAALSRGRALAVTECAGCHRFYWPDEYSPDSWPGIITKMGDLASLNEKQIKSLESYFVAASQATQQSGTINPSEREEILKGK